MHKINIDELINLTTWEMNNFPFPPTALGRFIFFSIIKNQNLETPLTLKQFHISEIHSSSGIRKLLDTMKKNNLIKIKKHPKFTRSKTIIATEALLILYENYEKKVIRSVEDMTRSA